MFFKQEISNYNPNTPDTNCKSKFLIENIDFNWFLKVINAQNQLPITFFLNLMHNKT